MLLSAVLLPVALQLPGFGKVAPTLGLPSLQLGAYGDAAAAVAGVAKEPNNGERWRDLGKLLHGKGRLDAACFALERAAALGPRDIKARIDLANALRSVGRFDEAAASLRDAETLGQRDQSLCYFRAPSETAAAPLPRLAADAEMVGGPASEADEVWVTRLASADECDWVIRTAEAHCTARGGWGNPPPRYAPAGTVADNVRAPHMLVADCPEMLDWFNAKLEKVVFPTLQRQFGEVAACEAWLYDAFLLKFDGQPGRRGLGLHVDDDGLGLSINLLLSDPKDFEGGGTFFEEGDFVITPR